MFVGASAKDCSLHLQVRWSDDVNRRRPSTAMHLRPLEKHWEASGLTTLRPLAASGARVSSRSKTKVGLASRGQVAGRKGLADLEVQACSSMPCIETWFQHCAAGLAAFAGNAKHSALALAAPAEKTLKPHPEVLCNRPARPNQWCHHPMTELARPAESPERSSSAKDSAGQSHETLESPPLDRMWPLCSACKVGQQYKSRKAVQKALRDSRQPSHWSCALPPKIIVSCRHVVTVTQRQDLEKYQDAGRVGRQRQDLPEAVWRKVGSSLCRWRRRHSTRASSPPHGHGRRCGK